MTSLHLHRDTPVSSNLWFAVAVPVTIVALVLAVIVTSASGNSWLGLGLFAAWVAAGLGIAWRTGHDRLAPYAGGAVVTMVALLAVPLIVAHYYIVN